MRILMLSQFYPPIIGGEERHVITLSEGLAKRGHEVHVACLPHPDRPARLERNGVTVHSVSGTAQRGRAVYKEAVRRHAPPFPDPELAFALARLTRALKPDVVHGHNWMSRSFIRLGGSVDPAFVVTLHDYSLTCAVKNMMRDGSVCPGPSPRACLSCSASHYGPVVGTAAYLGNQITSRRERSSVDRFIAVSRAVAKTCGLENRSTPYEVLPTFIPDDVSATPGATDERISRLPPDGFLLFVGDLNIGKGVGVILEAYKRLTNAPPLVLIGRRCDNTPSELPANVFVFESWPHHAVMQAWKRCLFGLAPSVWPEACGTIVMEANAVGKAMIATRTGGIMDLVEHGITGLLVAPGDSVELAAAMRRLIDDAKLRDDMGAASLTHVERFMAKSIVPRIETVYREAAAHRARRLTPRRSRALAPGGAQ